MRILLLLRQGDAWQRNVVVPVQVPEFRRNRVWVVRMGHRHGQAERLAGRVAHMVEQVLVGALHHLLVEVELVGAHTGPGLQHRGHVVVPARAHIGCVPVDRPAIVGRVDVARQPLFISVQLVRPAEMHLARQGGPVAQGAQVVGVGGHVGGEIGSVVEGADLRRQLAADQRKARGRAQRAVAVGGVEHHTAGGEPAQVRHLERRAGVVHRQQRRCHLVGHDEQDVGTGLGHGAGFRWTLKLPC